MNKSADFDHQFRRFCLNGRQENGWLEILAAENKSKKAVIAERTKRKIMSKA